MGVDCYDLASAGFELTCASFLNCACAEQRCDLIGESAQPPLTTRIHPERGGGVPSPSQASPARASAVFLEVRRRRPHPGLGDRLPVLHSSPRRRPVVLPGQRPPTMNEPEEQDIARIVHDQHPGGKATAWGHSSDPRRSRPHSRAPDCGIERVASFGGRPGSDDVAGLTFDQDEDPPLSSSTQALPRHQ